MKLIHTLLRSAGIRLAAMLTLALTIIGGAATAQDTAAPSDLKVLCTTFPVYLITKNVTAGREGLDLQLMISASLGCPHDYALTPQDMQKIARAGVLVINGLGMEEFLGAPIKNANPNIRIVDSSAGIKDTLNYTSEHHHHGEKEEAEEAHEEHHDGESEAHEGEHHEEANGEHHHHHHSGVNPHLFASPRMVAKMATNIAEGLAAADPAGAALYRKNAEAYAKKMNALADEFAALGKRLANNRIITQHGVFDYLARDMGLEVVAVVQAHAGEDPSAAEMREVIHEAKEEKAGAVFTEPQYPAKVGQTIAKEAGIPTASLDPVASGPETAGADYYETAMRANLKTLQEVLGVQ